MKTLIFTEGGSVSGNGHITRCLSFCPELISKGAGPVLIIKPDRTGETAVLETVNIAGLAVEQFDWHDIENLKNFMAAFIGRKRSAAQSQAGNTEHGLNVIADSYKAGLDVYAYLCEASDAQIFFDDYNRIDYPGGHVLNGAISAAKISYAGGRGVKYLLGPSYQPIRSEFSDSTPLTINEKVSRILITLGGSDADEVCKRILEALVGKFADIQKNIVTGRPLNGGEDLKKLAGENTHFHSGLSAAQMAVLMTESDMAVSAGGQTLYELASRGVPTIAFIMAENQRNNVNGFLELQAVEDGGESTDAGFENKITRAIVKLMSRERRRELSEISKKIVDGQGVSRCIKEVFKL
jgi:UDP-2,4-diacetamido-2,4,6-trideoxy-beta-L-altropyranose hydrolase